MANARAGRTWTLNLSFFDESGTLADPASVTLDITYGSEVGFVADYAGPFTYQGASENTLGQVWRISEGQYAFSWPVPSSAQTGVYVANWTCVYGGDSFLGVEDFPVSGGFALPVPAGDVGYWTGAIDYTPAAGNVAQLQPVSIPLGQVDGNGICWLIQKVEGWDGPDVQGGGVIPKSGDHGAWPAPQYYAARQLTLTVTASAPTQALRDLARALLQQAVPISDLALLTYNEPSPKQALVRRSGKITETYPTLCDVTFTIGMVAPDPRKYGTQPKTLQVNAFDSSLIGMIVPFTVPFTLPAQPPGGIFQLANAGTFETRPVITITGPISGPALLNVTTGQQVSWSGLVMEAGDTLVADFGAGQAFLNGVFAPADLNSSWWTLPPGVSTVQLAGSAGAGAGMSAAWRDAWI
jgi:hypothetical protein